MLIPCDGRVIWAHDAPDLDEMAGDKWRVLIPVEDGTTINAIQIPDLRPRPMPMSWGNGASELIQVIETSGRNAGMVIWMQREAP